MITLDRVIIAARAPETQTSAGLCWNREQLGNIIAEHFALSLSLGHAKFPFKGLEQLLECDVIPANNLMEIVNTLQWL